MNRRLPLAVLLEGVPIQVAAVVFRHAQNGGWRTTVGCSAVEMVFQSRSVPACWAASGQSWERVGDPFFEILAQLVHRAVRLGQEVGGFLRLQLLKKLPAVQCAPATQGRERMNIRLVSERGSVGHLLFGGCSNRHPEMQ